jgi:lysophospholipase L1-like esterase
LRDRPIPAAKGELSVPKQPANKPMNRTRIGLVIFALGALAIMLSWPRREVEPDSHRLARQLILHYTLSGVDDPIIVLGDSIVEASTLPRTLCGHAIVNAGLSGASTGSDLGNWLSGALAHKRAGLIVVALGTNDALGSLSQPNFETRYGALLDQLSTLTSHLVVMAIPAVEARNNLTVERRDAAMAAISGYNASLPALAKSGGATFVALPPMSEPHTLDGVHLNSAGYAVWDTALLQGAASICNSK